jgi:hypothetical protein
MTGVLFLEEEPALAGLAAIVDVLFLEEEPALAGLAAIVDVLDGACVKGVTRIVDVAKESMRAIIELGAHVPKTVAVEIAEASYLKAAGYSLSKEHPALLLHGSMSQQP